MGKDNRVVTYQGLVASDALYYRVHSPVTLIEFDHHQRFSITRAASTSLVHDTGLGRAEPAPPYALPGIRNSEPTEITRAVEHFLRPGASAVWRRD